MKVISSYLILLVLFVFANTLVLSGQTPANDLNWQLDTAKSDEFNLDSVNTCMWHVLDCPSGDCCNWGGGTAFQKGNVSDSGGILRLRVDGPGQSPLPCDRFTYNTGGIYTDSINYSYGYLEIYAELPGFNDNGSPCGSKFEPTFWTAYVKMDTSCIIEHDEIDVFDIDGIQNTHCDSVTSGWWRQDGHCSNYLAGVGLYHSNTPLYSAFHKYAASWQPNSLVFYFDDKPYAEKHNDTSIIMKPMRIFIDQQLSDTNIHFCPNMVFPQYYLIDYFRYYRLKLSCGTNVTLLTNTDLANYQYSVKSSITFGNGSNTISLNSGDVKYFRAVDSITIYGTFTAPLGSELGLIPTPCN